MPPHHIPISEAARRQGVNRSTIQRKIAKGELERVALKNGKVGVTIKSLEAAFGGMPQGAADAARTQQAAACRTVPHAAAAPAAPQAEEIPTTIATLRAELTAALQRQADIEELRRQVVQAQNEHIDSLRKELEQKARELEAANLRAEAAHQENLNLHRQLADARHHETERARIAPPTPFADVIESKPEQPPAEATKPNAKKSDARYRTRGPRPTGATPPTPKPELAGWWRRLWGG